MREAAAAVICSAYSVSNRQEDKWAPAAPNRAVPFHRRRRRAPRIDSPIVRLKRTVAYHRPRTRSSGVGG
jgi:hypothetical protein